MAFETKVILRSMADYALATKNKPMYRYISNLANVEGLTLKPYNEALEELESDDA